MTDWKEQARNYELEAINAEMLEACKNSLVWIAKVSADQPEGDPTGIGTRAMQQYAKVEQAIRHAEEQTK